MNRRFWPERAIGRDLCWPGFLLAGILCCLKRHLFQGRWALFLVHNADMGQIAALLGEVDSVADDEFIRNVKADPVYRHIYFAT